MIDRLQNQPGNRQEDPTAGRRRLWLVALLLVALAQVLWAGYQWGAGNQSIQVPFLKRSIDPGLYPQDLMVNETYRVYPTWFFRGLGLEIGRAHV